MKNSAPELTPDPSNQGISVKKSTLYNVSLRRIIPASQKSIVFIKTSYESLNYTTTVNKLEIEKQNSKTFGAVRTEVSLRILLFLLTGILTGLLGVFLEVAISSLAHFKFYTFEEMVHPDLGSTNEGLAYFIMTRFIGVFIPIIIGASLVIFITPYAAGGGVAQSIAYLNGIRVPHVLSIKGLVVKTFSTVCSCISGLAAGKEGPMLHMGTIIGGRLPSVFPWLQFRLDNERRDFAAAGFGAGLSVVFGAPIGGLLLALEEGVSFLEISLMWKIYLCCVVCYAVGTVVISLIYGVAIKLNNPDLLSFGTLSSDVVDYEWFEVIPFALLGVIGGIIGVLQIKIHVPLVLFRDHHIKTKTRKIILVVLMACFVTILQVLVIYFLRTCSNIPPEPSLHENVFKTDNITNPYQLYCPDGKRSDMYIMISQTQGSLLRLFYSKDLIHMSSLALFSVMYFILLCLTMILPISAGNFIPQVILGAAWGRLFGTYLNTLVNGAKWAKPAKYAYLGAAAQLSGTVGKTFSILVIFVEASGSVSLSFPLMIIVSITRVLCNFFTDPIYETQMFLMGLPFLSFRPPPLSCNIPVIRSMSDPPLITLPPSPRVSTIVDTLEDNNHNGYPIVETQNNRNVLIGLILRQQLLILLKHKAYKKPAPTTQQEMSDCFKMFMIESSEELNSQDIIDNVESEYHDIELDLSPYYDRYPNIATEYLPLIKAYETFRSLGIRHLVVITNSYEPIGMITRKDLAKYHTAEKCCEVKVKELFLK